MNYHNITKCDMLNGDGLRVVLWVAGCSHHCDGCHNQITWSINSGLPFTSEVKTELFEALAKPYIKGLTLSGGDPFHVENRNVVRQLLREVKKTFGPEKDVWVYTGYCIEDLPIKLLRNVDVLVDGKFVKELADPLYNWAGSTNQRVIRLASKFS